MLSKAQIKYIRSLTQQKFRNEYKVFIAEGEKIALEWLESNEQIQMIIATQEWVNQYHSVIARHGETELHIVKDTELATLSALQTPNRVMLIIPIPDQPNIQVKNEWHIALDNIQDPGNMGTIIRIADWFGINNIVCSPDCVDIYNPKVVQSAMGGHLRVSIYYADLCTFLGATPLPKIAATLNGENAYDIGSLDTAVLIIGNESKGISEKVAQMASIKVTIPRRGGAESLNAGVSAGILCALLVKM